MFPVVDQNGSPNYMGGPSSVFQAFAKGSGTAGHLGRRVAELACQPARGWQAQPQH